jgi:hypothetical protein
MLTAVFNPLQRPSADGPRQCRRRGIRSSSQARVSGVILCDDGKFLIISRLDLILHGRIAA